MRHRCQQYSENITCLDMVGSYTLKFNLNGKKLTLSLLQNELEDVFVADGSCEEF